MENTELKKPAKGVYLLPNMLTTLSMFLGFLAMVYAGQERFESACLAILVSGLMDSLDGKVARMTNTSSEFGVQFDSLADLVAFGLAPAFLFWHWQLAHLGRIGIAAAFFYIACGAMRLARFNITTYSVGKRFFIGLPIPAAGFSLVTTVFFASLLPDSFLPVLPWIALIVCIGAGLLMISRIKYFSFKEYDIFRAHPVRTMVAFLFLLALIVSWPRFFSFVYCLAYICCGLFYTCIILPRRNRNNLLLSTTNK